MSAMNLMATTLSSISPVLASRWLEKIFVTPRPYTATADEHLWVDSALVSTLRLGQSQLITTYEWGNPANPKVLLAHGWGARASQLGHFIEPLLRSGFHVVSYDAPAHGESNGKESALPEFADAMETVAAHFGELYACIAHSNGSAAATIALSRGMHCERVIYLAPPENFGEYLKRLAGFTGFAPRVARLTQKRLEQRFGLPFDAVRGSHLAAQLDVPALIFHDKNDRLVPFREGYRLASYWKKARLVPTDGLGHSRMLKSPEVIERSVDFLVDGLTYDVAIDF